MGVTPQDFIKLLNPRIKRILDIAEASLPPERYRAFRRVVLNEFGWSGMEEQLKSLLQRRP
jgi:hypothetical protein